MQNITLMSFLLIGAIARRIPIRRLYHVESVENMILSWMRWDIL